MNNMHIEFCAAFFSILLVKRGCTLESPGTLENNTDASI